MAGPVIQAELRDHGGSLVPIDSEHSAIWQCLQGEVPESVERLTLTASGGALRSLSLAKLSSVTPEQALRHPTWSMGSKITIDSANLMNKGLEVIEARWLFDMDIERIGVVLHAQSVVHSGRLGQSAARPSGHAPSDPVRAELASQVGKQPNTSRD